MALALITMLLVGVVWVGVLALGGVVAWRGIRGTRIDNAARCRRCGYDIGGPPIRPQRCSECGANLQRSGSVRLGTMRSRGSLVAFGVLIMLIGVSPVAVFAWRTAPRPAPAAAIAVAKPAPPARPAWNLAAERRIRSAARGRAADALRRERAAVNEDHASAPGGTPSPAIVTVFGVDLSAEEFAGDIPVRYGDGSIPSVLPGRGAIAQGSFGYGGAGQDGSPSFEGAPEARSADLLLDDTVDDLLAAQRSSQRTVWPGSTQAGTVYGRLAGEVTTGAVSTRPFLTGALALPPGTVHDAMSGMSNSLIGDRRVTPQTIPGLLGGGFGGGGFNPPILRPALRAGPQLLGGGVASFAGNPLDPAFGAGFDGGLSGGPGLPGSGGLIRPPGRAFSSPGSGCLGPR